MGPSEQGFGELQAIDGDASSKTYKRESYPQSETSYNWELRLSVGNISAGGLTVG